MNKKILLNIGNRYVKSILLKSIAKAELDILDAMDKDDMAIKLEAFGGDVVLAVTEITDENIEKVESEIECIKEECPKVPILAIVFKDTSDIVKFALNSGIKDVLLLPENTESYSDLIQAKMNVYYTRFNKQVERIKPHISEKIQQETDIKASLDIELKRAIRGSYSISFIMAYISEHEPKAIKSLIKNVFAFMRETDKLIEMDESTFIGVFPFAPKSSVPIIEEKFRDAFKSELSKMGMHKKLCLYSATYPHDGATLEALLDRLEMGINNSLVINSVNTPLNTMTKSEIEEYKKRIKQYKKFFNS